MPYRIDRGLDASLALMMPPTRQRRLMAVLAAIVLAISAGAAPFSATQLRAVNGFIPATESLVFILDLLTSYLLLTHSRIISAPSLLVLGSGYLFSAITVIPHALSFPGAFAPAGLLDAGLQGTGWLFILWHFSLPAAVIGYVCFDGVRIPISQAAICATAASVAAAALLVSVLAVRWSDLLPALFADQIGFTPLARYVTAFDFALAVLALAAISRRCTKSLISGWTTVAMVAMVAELAMVTFFIPGRFSLGFYLSRSLSVVVSMVVLTALLGQIVGQDARLARMNIALQFERDRRLMTVNAALSALAHELKQPLSAIAINAEAAELLLRSAQGADIARSQEALNDINADVSRAVDVLASVRDLFRSAPEHYGPLNLNELVMEVLRIFRDRIHHRSVAVDVRLDSRLPRMIGHRTQLQEVVFNLMQNALDAVGDLPQDRRRISVRTERRDTHKIVLSVDDSGRGIPKDELGRIFEVFVTSKKAGMGMGLAICRTIVDRHGGDLLARSGPDGTHFEVVLPADWRNITEREALDLADVPQRTSAPRVAPA